MITKQLKDFKPGEGWCLWEETGDGSLAEIKYVTADYWAKTAFMSWCCSPDTPIYWFASQQEKQSVLDTLQIQLKQRRGDYVKV